MIMKNKGLIFFGVALAAGYWLLESAIHVYMFHTGSFAESILPADANEIWMRMIIIGMFLSFGVFAQSLLNRRTQMEETLRHGEKLLGKTKADLAEAQRIAHLGSWSRDIVNGVLAWSDEHYRLFGLNRGEITPSFDVFLDFVHPDDRQLVRQAVDAALHESKPYCIDFHIIRQDGEARILHSQAEVTFDEMGKPIAITGTAQDVTEIRQAQAMLRRDYDKLEDSVETQNAKLVRSNETLRKEIAGRKQVEESLRESEERFRQLAENIREVFWVTDPDKQKMLYISPEYEKIWGRGRESLYQSPCDWIEAIHAGDREHVRKSTTTKQITGEYDEQYRVIRPDGSIRWIRDRAFPVRNDSGEVYRIAGIAEDITDIMQAKLLLQQSEENYHNIFEFSHDAIFIIDPETHGFLDVNENAARRLGYSREELLRLTIEDIYRPEAAKRTAAIIRELEKTGGAIFERVHRRKDGTDIPVEVSAKVISYNGRKVFQSSARDITKRKRAEESLRESEARLAGILDTASDAVVAIDDSQKILLFNKSAERIFGYRREEILGQSLDIIIPDKFCKMHKREVGDFAASIEDSRLMEDRTASLSALRKNGEVFPAEISISKLLLGGNKIFTAVIRDISERKLAEELEKQRMRQLAHTSRLEEMGRMAAEIAHELHQPLSAIRAYSETCLRMLKSGEEEPGKLGGVLDKIAGQAKRAGEVVHSVHDFSIKGEVCLLPRDVHDMVKEVMQLIQLETQCLGVRIRLTSAKALPPVLADRILIEQVLLNLMRNACEVMARHQEKDRILTIQTRMADEEFIAITVQDTGPSLSAHELEHLFDAFYSTKDSGMGLGLALSRLIIENHGGRIWAEAAPDGRTAFCFTLPIAGRVER